MKYYIRGEYSNDVKNLLYKIVEKDTHNIISVSDCPHNLRERLEKLNQIKPLAIKP